MFYLVLQSCRTRVLTINTSHDASREQLQLHTKVEAVPPKPIRITIT